MLDSKTLKPGIIRATILTSIAAVLVLAFHFPIYYAIILIAFFWIRVFPFTHFIDKKIVQVHPNYENSHHLLRKAVPYVIYILLLVAMKFVIVDVIATELLHLPVKEELYKFLNISPP